MRAASGSGKSTWIKTNFPEATVCSADNFFVSHGKGQYKFNPSLLGAAHKSCLSAFEKALAAGDNVVVVDNTNIRKSWYQDYVKLATAKGYEVFQKCLTTKFQNTHGVPEEKVADMIKNFEEDLTLAHWE